MAEQRINIKGPLTMATTGQIYRDIEKQWTQSDVLIEFSDITNVDSSAVALLVTLLKKARTASHKLRFGTIPPSILQFSEIYEMAQAIRSRS
jgi:ABC-type transporter Mla MlaB component